VILLNNWTLDNVQINKIQKYSIYSSTTIALQLDINPVLLVITFMLGECILKLNIAVHFNINSNNKFNTVAESASGSTKGISS
jgi:hypothetical protein